MTFSEEGQSAISADQTALTMPDEPFNFLSPGSFSAAQVQQISPGALAYLGDAVYELYIRSYYLVPAQRLQTYHSQVVAQVRAESQASHLQCLEPYLTTAELEIVKRGRNAAGRSHRAKPEIYQQASSLETLIGYLYLHDPSRLTELLAQLLTQLKLT